MSGAAPKQTTTNLLGSADVLKAIDEAAERWIAGGTFDLHPDVDTYLATLPGLGEDVAAMAKAMRERLKNRKELRGL